MLLHDSDFATALLNRDIVIMGESKYRIDLLGHFWLWPLQYLPEDKFEYVKNYSRILLYSFGPDKYKSEMFTSSLNFLPKLSREEKHRIPIDHVTQENLS